MDLLDPLERWAHLACLEAPVVEDTLEHLARMARGDPTERRAQLASRESKVEKVNQA